MSQSIGPSELLERLIADMRQRWQAGDKVFAESYVAEHPELESGDGLLSQLILAEFQLRREFGDNPDEADYIRRFPLLASRLPGLLQSEPPTSAPGRVASSTPAGAGTTVSVDAAAVQTDLGYEPARDLRPPLGIFGGYELLEEIAHGGMGVVYKARQIKANRTVALKMILSGQLASSDEVKRFQTEASAAAGLDHPNIVPIFEVGEHEGRHFYSMGFVDGQSLSELLRHGPLPPRGVARLMLQVTRAVEYAHAHGIIHRDLKPQNILLAGGGMTPRVADFGLAKQLSASGDLTATGQILGTPNFMSPEQARGDGGAIGPSSDIYSLGAMLYCLLTGRPPFQAANVIETLRQVVSQEPVSPRLLNDAVDRDLETITLRCLYKEPSKRYQSAAELAEDFERFLAARPIDARPIGPTERAWRWCRRNPLAASLLIAVAALLLLCAVGGASLALIANRYARRADENSERADRNTELASEAARKAAVETVVAEQRLAESYLDRGVRFAEEGEAGRGLLWMARALDVILATDDSLSSGPGNASSGAIVGGDDSRKRLEHAVRANLGAWRRSIERTATQS